MDFRVKAGELLILGNEAEAKGVTIEVHSQSGVVEPGEGVRALDQRLLQLHAQRLGVAAREQLRVTLCGRPTAAGHWHLHGPLLLDLLLRAAALLWRLAALNFDWVQRVAGRQRKPEAGRSPPPLALQRCDRMARTSVAVPTRGPVWLAVGGRPASAQWDRGIEGGLGARAIPGGKGGVETAVRSRGAVQAAVGPGALQPRLPRVAICSPPPLPCAPPSAFRPTAGAKCPSAL